MTIAPFEFYIDPDTARGDDRVKQAVFQALGAVSVCWDNPAAAGKFESTRAKEIGERLVEFIRDEAVDYRTTERQLEHGITALVEQSGTNSRDHGFHDDTPDREDFVAGERGDKAFANAQRNWWIAKLDLMHEELSEMLGELRSGKDVHEVYYLDKVTGETHISQYYVDGVPTLKPEGFGIELADLMIRGADLAYLAKLPLAQLIAIKHSYNKTRPYKHGRTL